MDFLIKVLGFSFVQLANWIGVIDNFTLNKKMKNK